MKSTFSVIYYLKRQVVKKDGTVPVMGRITVDGSQTQFSCKLTVDPKLWDTKGGRVTGRSTAALETNRMLDKMRVRINKHYQEIMERDNFVTAEKVKNAFLGLEHHFGVHLWGAECDGRASCQTPAAGANGGGGQNHPP